MTHKIFIDGEAGTTGLEIKKRLSDMPDIELLRIKEELRKDTDERLRLYGEAEIIFLCLPDEQSRAISALASPDTRIIDASTAHRVNPEWVYGMPELTPSQRDNIKKANRVANPGCHATGFILLARPLIDAGLIDKDSLLSAHSITGYSGGGKSMIANYESDDPGKDEDLVSPGQYGLTQNHKHLPEMAKYGGVNIDPVFMPIVADYYRGMLVSIPVHASMFKAKASLNDISDLYQKRYAEEELISVRSAAHANENAFIYAQGYKGRDDLEIMVAGNDERMTLIARYDNLGKGASGAAIQNMNLMLDRPEYEGMMK